MTTASRGWFAGSNRADINFDHASPAPAGGRGVLGLSALGSGARGTGPMRLSSRALYGMRAVLALARHHGKGSIFLKDIAEQERLPGTYLEQLMVPLRKAGIVLGVRGAKGGYVLSRPPESIPVLAVLEALEGPLSLAECPGGSGCCGHPGVCVLQELWAEGSGALACAYRGLSLATLVERQRGLDTRRPQDYTI